MVFAARPRNPRERILRGLPPEPPRRKQSCLQPGIDDPWNSAEFFSSRPTRRGGLLARIGAGVVMAAFGSVAALLAALWLMGRPEGLIFYGTLWNFGDGFTVVRLIAGALGVGGALGALSVLWWWKS